MATSVVGICNMALSHIRAQAISSIDEPSAEARACKIHYEQARDSLLSVFAWDFAAAYQSLAAVTTDWPQRYALAYRLPVDCLKVRRLISGLDLEYSQQPTAYALRGLNLYTSLPEATLEYTQTITDPTRFPALFVDALSWSLAARIAPAITGDRSIQSDAANMAERMRMRAEAQDANQSLNRPDYEPESIAARA